MKVKHNNPKKTPSTYPRRRVNLESTNDGNRIMYCSKYGFVRDRDMITRVNLFIKYPKY